ncbi:MAG: hypothetical protein JWR11_3748 [Mycobacterium sp.]|nr:hypothetical protein [Mycobacterium sp.]
MGAPLEICRRRTVCAVLASGVVISLTALTGGIAPAFAEPGTEPGVPVTTVVPQPPVAATQVPVEQPTAAQAPTPAAPKTVEAPPVVETPVQPTVVEAPPETRAPEPEPVSTPTRQAPPSSAPSSAPPVTTATKSPTTSTPETTSSAAPTSPSVAPRELAPPSSSASESTASSSASASTSAESSPSSRSAETPSEATPSATPSSSSTSPATSESASNASESSATSTSSATSATSTTSSTKLAGVIEKVAPQTLVAPEEDVQTALAAKVVEEKPVEAPKQEIADISRVIDLPNRDRGQQNDRDGRHGDDQVQLAGGWDRNVRQWRPDWVQYDEYYRPVLSNPYRDPVRIVYVYQNAPRVVWIPPLARVVLEVAQYAAYSFTAVVTNTINQAVNVAVGSFFGGGYFPGVGLPLPPPPPPLVNYSNVPVQVRYPDATYQPFRVNKIVDVGPDAQFGEQKVLLDGVTPAWGQWKQTPSGERSFEVHKTQQFPGLDDPQPGPLPGDYQLTLASDQSPAGMNNRDVYLIAVAIACGALSIGAVILAVLMGRRRRSQH